MPVLFKANWSRNGSAILSGLNRMFVYTVVAETTENDINFSKRAENPAIIAITTIPKHRLFSRTSQHQTEQGKARLG